MEMGRRLGTCKCLMCNHEDGSSNLQHLCKILGMVVCPYIHSPPVGTGRQKAGREKGRIQWDLLGASPAPFSVRDLSQENKTGNDKSFYWVSFSVLCVHESMHLHTRGRRHAHTQFLERKQIKKTATNFFIKDLSKALVYIPSTRLKSSLDALVNEWAGL